MRYSIFDMNMWKQQENVEKWRFTLLGDVTIAMARARSEILTSFLETRDNQLNKRIQFSYNIEAKIPSYRP